jgi:tRNA (guanine-N7-)-methyltransferase
MARKRHRKSINPFRLQLEIERPDWASILAPGKPIEVDLGFGRGEFVLEMARRHPDTEFVGLEIRSYLIEKAEKLLEEEPLPNVHVLLANVKEHLPALFDPGSVSRVYIHFPDPWTSRKKHHKRRMVDASLVATLHTLLVPGGEVHLMTDKEEIGLEMRTLFEAHGGFENACGAERFCAESTTGIQTREEQYYLGRGDRIYRLKFARQ